MKKKKMTKQELIDNLKALHTKDDDKYVDNEDTHIRADELLLEFINDKEVSEAFNNIDKWYA